MLLLLFNSEMSSIFVHQQQGFIIVRTGIYLVILLTVQGWSQGPLSVPGDSLAASAKDSLRYYRTPKPKKPKTLNFYLTEYMVKSNLARLSYYAQGRYMNSYDALGEMFLQANQFPEETKNRMFVYALAGGVAREIFRETRKQLVKRKLGFVYPNLYGMNVTWPLPLFKAQAHFRTTTFKNQFYGLSMAHGRLYFIYRQTDVFQQKAAYLRLYRNVRLFGLRSDYQKTSYNGIGLSNYSRKLFLYFIFLQNPEQPQYNRATLFINVDLN